MEITGTIQAPDGSNERISAEGNTCEEARKALTTQIPEDHKLLAIRTDQ